MRFEVHFEGQTYSFNDPGRFLLWQQDRGKVSKEDVFWRGVLTRGEEGSPEVTAFFRKELRLAPTLVRWQRRSIQYLRNRCGHRFCEEGAICETRQSEIVGSRERRGVEWNCPACNFTEVMTLALHHPVTSESRHRLRLRGGGVGGYKYSPSQPSGQIQWGSSKSNISLSLQTPQKQQPPLQPKSPPLTLFELEAIRTHGCPWSGPPAKQFTQDAWYPIWHLFQQMHRRKNKVIRRLKF